MGMLVVLIIGLFRWQFVLTNFGPAVIWRWINPFIWIGIGFGFIGGVGLFLLLRSARQEIQLSPMGITWRKGRKLQVFRWEDIENVFITSFQYGILDFAWGNRIEILLHLHNGERLKINQVFENIETLMETMKHYAYPRMFEKVRQAFNQGEPTQFGPIILTSQGVLNGKRTMRWQEIGKIQLQRGYLQLQPIAETHGPKFSIPVHKIPNIDLCIQILLHFGPQT
jgi:hypothetical protein